MHVTSTLPLSPHQILPFVGGGPASIGMPDEPEDEEDEEVDPPLELDVEPPLEELELEDVSPLLDDGGGSAGWDGGVDPGSGSDAADSEAAAKRSLELAPLHAAISAATMKVPVKRWLFISPEL